MTDIRSKIDELIEESYLVTLPEEAIRKDLLQFLEACDRIVRTSRDERKRGEIIRRLNSFTELALHVDKASELADESDHWTVWSEHDLLAHRAARLKLVVLESVRSIDQSIAEEIEQVRFPKTYSPSEPVVGPLPTRRVPTKRPWFVPATTAALLRGAYALLAAVTLFIIGYRFFH